MAANKYVKALVSVILLIVLVFVLQLVVGVFGVAGAQVNNSLQVATTYNSANPNQAVKQFGQVGQSNATIIPFITVIVIVALVVILLDLFGIGDILNLGGSSE